MIFKYFIKNKLSPKWQYLIWIVLILKLLIPFGPESAVSLFNVVPEVPSNISFSKAYEQVQINIADKKLHTSTINTPLLVQSKSLSIAVALEATMPFIWLIGVVLISLWLFYTYYSIYRKLRKGYLHTDERIQNIFKSCKAKMGVGKNIEIAIQDVIGSPCLFGIIHPKILLFSAIEGFTDKEIEYILLHELAHHKRKDVMINYLLLSLQVIHWFNPVIWYCFKRIRQDMEVATDERVLLILEKKEKIDYGRTLIMVLEKISVPRFAPKLIGMIDDKKSMERRIKMIKTSVFFKSKSIIVFIVGLLCVGVLGSVMLTNGRTKGDTVKNPVVNNKKDIRALGNNSALELVTSPEKYSSVMSSTPGIQITAKYTGTISKIRYSANSGTLMSWNIGTGEIKQFGLSVELTDDMSIYWAPLNELNSKIADNSSVIVEILDGSNKILDKKQLDIKCDKDGIYTVQISKDIVTEQICTSEIQKPKTIEEAVSNAIMLQNKSNTLGEVSTEGHIILDIEEKNETVKVYAVSSYGRFGFENGIFTFVSGSSSIPTVITFSKDIKGKYSLEEYKEPLDGSEYNRSVKDMFPEKVMDKLANETKFPDIEKQMKKQATEYLQSIGIKAKVSDGYVEKKLPDIDLLAVDGVIDEGRKISDDFNNFPYWLGSVELLDNGIRYIYETSQTKTSDDFDLMVFKKTKEDGTLVKEYQYKVFGNELQRLK